VTGCLVTSSTKTNVTVSLLSWTENNKAARTLAVNTIIQTFNLGFLDLSRCIALILTGLLIKLNRLRRNMDPLEPVLEMQPIGYRLSAIDYRLSTIGYRLSAIGYRLSAIGYRLSAISYRLLAIGYRHPLIRFAGHLSSLKCEIAIPRFQPV